MDRTPKAQEKWTGEMRSITEKSARDGPLIQVLGLANTRACYQEVLRQCIYAGGGSGFGFAQ
jgi:hypothetical protein